MSKPSFSHQLNCLEALVMADHELTTEERTLINNVARAYRRGEIVSDGNTWLIDMLYSERFGGTF